MESAFLGSFRTLKQMLLFLSAVVSYHKAVVSTSFKQTQISFLEVAISSCSLFWLTSLTAVLVKCLDCFI